MRIKRLGLIAAAVLGGLLVCSTAATAQDTNAPAGNGKKGGGIEQRMAHLDELLSLTPEQKPKVRAALEAAGAARREARDLPDDQRREKMHEVLADLNKKMKEILTPDQYDKWLANAEKGKKGGKKSDSTS